MNRSFPRGWTAKREPEACRLRSPRGAGRCSCGPLRGRSGANRRIRTLLVVRRGHGDVPGRRQKLAVGRVARSRATFGRAQARDGLPGGAPGRRDRCTSRRTPVRGAGVRHLPAAVKARLSTDGGSRGNPGPAAYGYVLETEDGTVLDARGEAIGRATNNVAEYRGLVAGLAKAVELGVTELDVVSDSELLVKQMQGEYRVKNEALRELWERASDLERRFAKVRYTAVGRAHHELA